MTVAPFVLFVATVLQ